MTDIPEGAGSVAINFNLKAPGYLIICPDHKQGIPKGVSVYLTHAFHEWVLKNPQHRVRASLGIVEDGQTVMIHVWYDEEELLLRTLQDGLGMA